LEDAPANNTQTPPDEQPAFRLNVPTWLRTQTDRDRRLIADLTPFVPALDATEVKTTQKDAVPFAPKDIDGLGRF
jgi:hypothetical protein